MVRASATFLGIAAITVALAEVTLRIASLEVLTPESSPESMFWERNESIGWIRTPSSTGRFANHGIERGWVTNDAHGNRQNSVEGTFLSDARTVFFIGDSTTASLEVDDSQTVPAILEETLRERGERINVVNLGVRGYGTDQAVRRALDLAAYYAPTDIFYLHTDNDIYNNNVLKQGWRKFGKGVYLRRPGDREFREYNYPVPDYPENYAGLVLFDESCQPLVHETKLRRSKNPGAEFLLSHSFVARAIAFFASQPKKFEPVEPYDLVTRQGVRWHDGFVGAYLDGFTTRLRCAEYFESQFTFLLERLRSIESLERVHLVQFPASATMRRLREGKSSLNSVFFAELAARGTIDSYVDLPGYIVRDSVPIESYRCEKNNHFCEQGNRWVASAILAEVDW